ncbi:hypothetical protein T190_07230 [Sinorhizobium meliloti CCBAU 01290]|nr:hypothetical protein T190_07230 [Sinorhizobium meliloti CCBAU 01290]
MNARMRAGLFQIQGILSAFGRRRDALREV